MAIGYGQMDSDGTISLYLVASDGAGLSGCAMLTYTTSDPIYAQLVAHLGGLTPGNSATYEPWPDADPNLVA